MVFSLGACLGVYEIAAYIGEGGMSQVCLHGAVCNQRQQALP